MATSVTLSWPAPAVSREATPSVTPARFLVPDLVRPSPSPDSSLAAGRLTEDTIPLDQSVDVPAGKELVTLHAAGLPVQEVLQTISDMKHLNMVIDPSVTGTVAVDFQGIALNTVLETLMATNGLTMQRVGNSLIVYHSGRFGEALIKFIPIQFSPASEVVSKITEIVGTSGLSGASNAGGTEAASGSADSSGGSGGSQGFSPVFKLIADPQTNSLIVHGTADDIQLVEELAHRLDILMPSKIFHLKYMTPSEAIAMLRSTYFVGAGSGTNTVVSGGGAGSGSGSGSGGAAGAAAAGGSSGTSGGSGFEPIEPDFANTTPGSKVTMKQIALDPTEGTPRFIPLERDNSIMVIGDRADLQLVERILPTLDKRPKQVLLRMQIVELDGNAQKT
ncbi:MAG: hypothetical protein KGR26_03080, partial [Cyanobacteria bacterium REEB65]|nr:hypothetical protein [Cyanobacteria bacterium REEB65]